MANHLSHDALRIPIRGAKFNVRIPFDNPDDAAESFDTEISKDNGAFADCTNEIEVVGGGTSCDMGYLTLTAAEMTANSVVLKLSAVSGVQPTLIDFEPANLPAVYSGTMTAGSTTQFTMASGNRPSQDGAVVGMIVRNNTTGEAREIKTYIASTGVATFDTAETAFANTHTYDVLLPDQALTDYWDTILTRSAVEQTLLHVVTNLPDVLSLVNIKAQAASALGDAGVSSGVMALLDVAISTRLATASYTTPLSAAGTRVALGLSAANLDSQIAALAAYIDTEVASILAAVDTETAAILAAVDTEVAAIKAKTDLLPASPAATGDIPSAAAIVSAVFAELIEAGYSFKQAVQLIAAVCGGKTTGAGTATETFKSLGGNSNRVAATYDSSGNRATVTLTP